MRGQGLKMRKNHLTIRWFGDFLIELLVICSLGWWKMWCCQVGFDIKDWCFDGLGVTTSCHHTPNLFPSWTTHCKQKCIQYVSISVVPTVLLGDVILAIKRPFGQPFLDCRYYSATSPTVNPSHANPNKTHGFVTWWMIFCRCSINEPNKPFLFLSVFSRCILNT